MAMPLKYVTSRKYGVHLLVHRHFPPTASLRPKSVWKLFRTTKFGSPARSSLRPENSSFETTCASWNHKPQWRHSYAFRIRQEEDSRLAETTSPKSSQRGRTTQCSPRCSQQRLILQNAKCIKDSSQRAISNEQIWANQRAYLTVRRKLMKPKTLSLLILIKQLTSFRTRISAKLTKMRE